MITRTERIRLGFFLVLGLLLAAAFFFFTIGRSLLEKNDQYIIEYTESISGLNIGNAVKMSGVSIGQVENLRFAKDDVGRILVTISVRKGIPIKADAEAVVEVFGITGMKFIDILKGSNSAPRLAPGSHIRAGISKFDQVTGRAEDIAAKIEVALNNIINFTNADNMQTLARAINTTNELARNLNQLVNENRTNITAFTGGLAQQGGKLGDISTRITNILSRIDSSVGNLSRVVNNKPLQKSLKNLETITDNVRDGLDQGQLGKTINNLNQTLDASGKTINEFNRTITQSRDRLNSVLDKLDATTRNLADFTNKIKENPSLLIRKQEE
jgi:phospholipid/cholesterol/gamma-HCH transport system substrate-binding protein